MTKDPRQADLDDPMAWKRRGGVEPIPLGKRDPIRAARGIGWWVLGSLWLWAVLTLLLW